MPAKPITVYMRRWHIHQSPAFHYLLLNPLSHLPFRIKPFEEYVPGGDAGPVVFCMDLPSSLPDSVETPHTWIPMADWFLDGPIDAWNTLPSYLRIASFSNEMERMARVAGLRHISLKYYVPALPGAHGTHRDPRAIMYWNRRGLLDRDSLRALCEVVGADRLFFRSSMDPGLPPAARFRLGRRLGGTTVVHLPKEMDRADYLECLRASMVFVAPRAAEGVGLTFLEALAYGCAVVALDRPTMNEYIYHGTNGALLPFSLDRYRDFCKCQQMNTAPSGPFRSLMRFLPHCGMTPVALSVPLISDEDVVAAGLCDAKWEAMAEKALEMSRRGYSRWLDSLDRYSRFISGEDLGA